MLSRRKKFLLIAAGMVVLGLFTGLLVKRSAEGPVYKWRTLEAWILRYYATTLPNDSIDADTRAANAERARVAITNIGTNGIPFLLKWIDYNPPPPSQGPVAAKLRSFLEYVFRRSVNFESKDAKWIRADAAMIALGLLGHDASPAVPQLTMMFKTESTNVLSPGRAGRVFTHLGADGVRVFIECLSDPNREVRYIAAGRLSEMGEQARPAIPALIKTLDDPTRGVSLAAADALGILALEPAQCVPALIPGIASLEWQTRSAASRALGKFGTNAVAAIPTLLSQIEVDNDSAHTNALNKIAPHIYAEKFGK